MCRYVSREENRVGESAAAESKITSSASFKVDEESVLGSVPKVLIPAGGRALSSGGFQTKFDNSRPFGIPRSSALSDESDRSPSV